MHNKSGMKQYLTSWHLWVMVAIIGGALLFQNVIGGSTILFLALLLVCPIMMMFMMGGHKH